MNDIEKELKREVKSIAKDIKKIKYEKIGEFLEDAVDVQILTDINNKKIVGLSTLITFGGPNIEFIIKRGKAEIVGNWGSVEYREYIDINKANEFLEYLNEILNY
jgi:phosphomevalonate kinase